MKIGIVPSASIRQTRRLDACFYLQPTRKRDRRAEQLLRLIRRYEIELLRLRQEKVDIAEHQRSLGVEILA